MKIMRYNTKANGGHFDFINMSKKSEERDFFHPPKHFPVC